MDRHLCLHHLSKSGIKQATEASWEGVWKAYLVELLVTLPFRTFQTATAPLTKVQVTHSIPPPRKPPQACSARPGLPHPPHPHQTGSGQGFSVVRSKAGLC